MSPALTWARARPAAAAAVPGLLPPRRARVRRLQVGAAAHRTADLRALRCAHRLAGAAVRGMQRPEARVRACACRGRVRRAGQEDRGRMEGARPAPACVLGGADRGRHGREARRRGRRVRAGWAGPPAEAWPPCCRAPRARAGGGLGPSARAGRASHTRSSPPARSAAGGEAPQHCGSVLSRNACPRAGCPRRRRLHDRRDRQCGVVRAPKGRGQAGRGRDFRPRDSHQLRSESAHEETRCDCT
jgi:hypothetical protein